MFLFTIFCSKLIFPKQINATDMYLNVVVFLWLYFTKKLFGGFDIP